MASAISISPPSVPALSSLVFPVSLFAKRDGEGYRNSARWVWLAITAILLPWLKARWALMKMSRFAIALERERVSERRAHALGFVSRIIVRRERGGSREGDLVSVGLEER